MCFGAEHCLTSLNSESACQIQSWDGSSHNHSECIKKR